MSQRIIIVGGGFGGVKCARTLRHLLPPDTAEIILFNRENHMVFHPLLAEVASAAVPPKDVGAPLRQLLKGVQCRTEEVTNVDVDKRQIVYEAYDAQMRSMSFDHLVLTCGNTVNLSLVPGMDEHAFPLKTIGDALTLQSHIMEQLEKAEVCENPDRKHWYLTFVVVGGGFSGVEVAGEINDLVRSSTKFFQTIKEKDIKVIIVHGHDSLLPEVSERLRIFTKTKMEQAGVTVMLNSRAILATPEGLRLSDGTFLHASTVVCTIGTTTQTLIEKLTLPKTHGRLVTAPDMSIPGHPNIWAFGDCAAVVNSLDGSVCPTIAQFAERQGVQAGRNIAAKINGQATKPFKFRMQGSLCAIGGRKAVAEIFGFHISGFPAWFLWRGIYLMKLPSLAQKFKVGMEWAFDLMFPRTLACLKADPTKRVCRAFYASDDYVFRRGDPATEFYVIENGQVEILEHASDGTARCVAILGAGDFFGESSLLDSTIRNHSVRAQTELICMILGRNVFNQISSGLAPVRKAVADAARRRRSMWQSVPDVRQMLEGERIETMLEPLPMAPVPLNASVEQVIATMNETGADLCCVVNKEGGLEGVITRSDLLRAIEIAALADPDVDLNVTEIMVANPVTMSLNEPLAVAVSTMRDHDLKQIPIIDSGPHRVPKGRIRIEKIVSHVLAEMLARKKRDSSVEAPLPK
jgi:NADH dehydrogenase